MGLEQFSTRGERPYCRSWRAAFGIYLLPQETSRLGILRFRGSIVGVVGEGGAAGWRERRVGGGHGRWAGVSASAGTGGRIRQVRAGLGGSASQYLNEKEMPKEAMRPLF